MVAPAVLRAATEIFCCARYVLQTDSANRSDRDCSGSRSRTDLYSCGSKTFVSSFPDLCADLSKHNGCELKKSSRNGTSRLRGIDDFEYWRDGLFVVEEILIARVLGVGHEIVDFEELHDCEQDLKQSCYALATESTRHSIDIVFFEMLFWATHIRDDSCLSTSD